MSAGREIPAGDLLGWLTEDGDRVILRNPRYVAHLESGGDMDVLVGDVAAASASAVARFGLPLGVSRWSYVAGHLWQWGVIDMIPRLEWHGAEYVRARDVIDAAICTDSGVRVAHPAHEALACWLGKLLWSGRFPDKYRELILSAAATVGTELTRALTDAVGPKWAARLMTSAYEGNPEVSSEWVDSLRRSLWLRAFLRNPARTVRQWTEHWTAWLHVHAEPPMPWLACLGLDGSGKSSVLSALAERLENDYWSRGVRLGHWSPGVLRRRGKSAQGPVTDPHGRRARGRFMSILKLAHVVADWWIGYASDLARFRREYVYLLYDRHYVDLLVDQMRYRYGGPVWLVKLVSRAIPHPDVFVVLDLPERLARERKAEVAPEDARVLRAGYLALARTDPARYHVIDASRELLEVVDVVESILVEACRARSAARLPTE